MRTSINENKTRNNSKYIIGLRCIFQQFKRVTKLVKLLISTTSILVTAFENCWVEIGIQVVFNSAGHRSVLLRLNWACYCVGHHGSSSPQVAVALRTCPSHRCRLCIVSNYYDQRRCARCPTITDVDLRVVGVWVSSETTLGDNVEKLGGIQQEQDGAQYGPLRNTKQQYNPTRKVTCVKHLLCTTSQKRLNPCECRSTYSKLCTQLTQ